MIHVLPDEHSLAIACADFVAQTLAGALERRERASFVLTGGQAPRRMYRMLAERHRRALRWDQVDYFWGDDRFVPPDDDESNFGMARENLLSGLGEVGCNVFPMPTSLDDPGQAADAYEQTLRAYFADAEPRFDLVLLGLGADGHVASLFPGSPVLDESRRWVAHTQAPEDAPVRERITMTFPLLNAGETTLFLVAGEAKREAVARAQRGDYIPASRIRPRGELVWYVDEAAAAEIEH